MHVTTMKPDVLWNPPVWTPQVEDKLLCHASQHYKSSSVPPTWQCSTCIGLSTCLVCDRAVRWRSIYGFRGLYFGSKGVGWCCRLWVSEGCHWAVSVMLGRILLELFYSNGWFILILSGGWSGRPLGFWACMIEGRFMAYERCPQLAGAMKNNILILSFLWSICATSMGMVFWKCF